MDFYLGGAIAPDGTRTGDRTVYDSGDLTTHGVIVGMTGSGKTGLGIIYLEEALRQGIPALVIDPKGDMTNLLLTFPDLAPDDFAPWVDPSEAERHGRSIAEEATEQATTWRNGLASWDLAGSDIAAMRERSDMTIYTPGSDAGVPINVVGDLRAPTLAWDEHSETIRAEIQGFVSGLLGLVGIDADPIASREHILVANLVEHAWSAGRDLTLEQLIEQILTPPMRKLGVFDVDTFFPDTKRTAFAMQLNGLLASPSFAAWMQGEAVDIESLLWRDGRPQAAVVYLAHLSDPERQFIVTTILGKLITWMRSQTGSGDLRVLAYMDEVFGFAPPTATPPAKLPILTILKQGRAFGVGMLLSTQNPVDLDYKAMSNAGTWCIGRLQTERDKARILEGLAAASGSVDLDAIDNRISGLGTRQFVLHTTRRDVPSLFTTRWAMSYLRGPMTKAEVASVTDTTHERSPDAQPTTQRDTPPEVSIAAASTKPPPTQEVAEGISVRGLSTAAPWASEVGFDPDGDHLEAIVAVSVKVRYDDTRTGIDHSDQWEAVAPILTRDPRDMTFIEVDHDARDFVDIDPSLPVEASPAPISQRTWFDDLARAIVTHLDRSANLELRRNRTLGLISRPTETATTFGERCATEAENRADQAMAKLRDRFERKIRSARRAYEDAVRDARSAGADLDEATGDTILGAGLDLLMGRKPSISASRTRTASSRLRKAEDRVERTRTAFEDLGIELEDELRAIQIEWRATIDDIEPLTIGLESEDIAVEEMKIVWVRRGASAPPSSPATSNT